MSESDTEDAGSPYATQATKIALGEVKASLLNGALGSLKSWKNFSDEQGVHLQLVVSSNRHNGQEIVYDRLVEPSYEPEKDSTTAGLFYASAFEERLRTRQPTRVKTDSEDYLTL